MRIYSFLKQYCSRSRILLYLVLQCLFAFVSFMTPEVFKNGVDAIAQQSLTGLQYTAILAVVSTVLYLGLDLFLKLWRQKLVNDGEKALELALVDTALELTTCERRAIDGGKFLTKAIKNAMAAVGNALVYLTGLVCGVATIIFSLIYMGFLQWQMMLIIVAYNAVWQLVATRVVKKMDKNAKETVQAEQASNSFLLTLLHNMMTVRVYGKQQFYNQTWFAHEKTVLHKGIKRFIWSNGFQDSTWAMVKLGEFVILYGVGSLFVYWGYTTIGVLLALMFASDLLAKGIEMLTYSFEYRSGAAANIGAVNELLENGNVETGYDAAPVEAPFAIKVQDVSFSFGQKVVLQDVNFCIHPGEHVLITGPNGGGKSTLLNLLCGLYRPERGTIYYGSRDTTLIRLTSLAQNYAYISQEGHILDRNLFENIALSDDYAEEDVLRVLQQLNIGHILHTAPTLVSQGEKQRINIGRALYRADSVTVLVGDEIFSNVDKENAAHIADVLEQVFDGKTMIFVAHTDMPLKFDKILTVEGGRITVEEGV